MDQILKGLDQNVDVTVYADPTINRPQMQALRLLLKQGRKITIQ